jgi:hypothetical protein
MRHSIKNAYEDFEKVLLKAASYSGNKEPGRKMYSASMLGNDVLQNYYKYKYGSFEDTVFGANTLGSIYQLGVDEAFKDEDNYVSALRLKHKLDNGWEISGEMDQLDKKNKIIFDNKVTTSASIKTIKKEGKYHQYALQLGVYKYLLNRNGYDGDFAGVLALVDKKFSYFNKTNSNDQLTFLEVETFNTNEIEAMLIEKTNELDKYIELGIEPDKCRNLFYYNKKPMKCLHYCDYKSICKYNNNTQMKQNELLGL